MTAESKAREAIVAQAASLFARGLTPGASGNISLRLEDGSLLVTPTGSSFRSLDAARLSRLDADGKLLSGDAPTKEVALHSAFYATRPGKTGAVVHLHSSHAVAWSLMPDLDPDNMLPPLTAYAIMKLGKVKLLPYYAPGDPEMGTAVRALGGKHAAVVLANHGPVVAAKDLEAAVYAMEELEETAKLALLTRGRSPRLLSDAQIADLVRRFQVEWD